MNVVYHKDAEIAAWVAARIDGCERGFGECRALGVASGGKVIAGVVYHNWSPETGVIEVSCAADSPKWATRAVLTELFSYPFSMCRLVVTRFSEKNVRVEKLWKAFGSKMIRLPDMRADGEDEILAILSKSQWIESRLFDGQT